MDVNQYKEIKRIFDCLCSAASISEERKKEYFIPEIFRTKGQEQSEPEIYDRMCFSLQNTSHMRNSINMSEFCNNRIIEKVLYNYDYKKVSEYSKWEDVYDELKREGITDNGKGDKRKTNWQKFCEGIYEGAKWLIKEGYPKVKELTAEKIDGNTSFDRIYMDINIIEKAIPNMGTALVCDWLKECGCTWLVKPDVHIRSVYAHFTDKEVSKCLDKDIIREMYEWASDLQKYDSEMTAYKLDRIIWLICTGDFFLDNKKIGRQLLTMIK